MASAPAVPDPPTVVSIAAKSITVSGSISGSSNGNGGSTITSMYFGWGPSIDNFPDTSPDFTATGTQQYTITTWSDPAQNYKEIPLLPNKDYWLLLWLCNALDCTRNATPVHVKTAIGVMEKPTAQPMSSITSSSMVFNLDSNTTNNSNGSPLDNAEVQWSTSSSFATIIGDEVYNTAYLLYTATGLNPGTTYYFRGRTHNSAGWSAWSNTASAKTTTVLPGAPSAPVISSVTATSVYGTFTNPANLGGGTVLEKQIGYGTSATAPSLYSASDATISSLTRFTTYYFWARVRNESGWGPWSSVTSVRTKAQAPAAPTGITLSNITITSVDVNYTAADNGGDPATVYQIGYGTDPNTVQFLSLAPNKPTTISGLTRSTTYYVWMRAYNNDATGAWSARSTLTTLADYPAAPTAVVFSNITQLTVHASFSLSPDDGGSPITSQQLGYGTDPNTPTTIVTYGGGMDITGLQPGITYYFWARAQNVRGWGPWSTRAQVTTVSGARVRVNGVWKNAVPYVRSWSLWVRAQPYINVNGVWKKTG